MPSKRCLGEIYGQKFLITLHVMLCALWDAFERVDYEEWVIGLTEITLGQYLWMLRQRSANLDGTDTLVISRGLSNAYDHEMSTLRAIVEGEWLRDPSEVPLADVALALHAHGVVEVKERNVISLEGSARDGVFEPLLGRVCDHTTPSRRSCRSWATSGASSTRWGSGATRPPSFRSTPRTSCSSRSTRRSATAPCASASGSRYSLATVSETKSESVRRHSLPVNRLAGLGDVQHGGPESAQADEGAPPRGHGRGVPAGGGLVRIRCPYESRRST